jgi:hypothetical protein
MTRDDDNLRQQCEHVADTVRRYAALIESGEYGGEWAIYAPREDEPTDRLVSSVGDIVALSEDDAIERARDYYNLPADMDIYAELVDEFYEPCLPDGLGDISDYPLEIVDERGREYAVVICTGGPHIEVVADGGNRARIEGYWWGSRCTLTGDYFDVFLDWFIERD